MVFDPVGALNQPISLEFSTGNGPSGITAADFNRDGWLDIATANANAGTASVLLGDGAANFTLALPNTGVGVSPQSLVTADFNQDGIPDLAVTNAGSGSVSVLQGSGSGTFSRTNVSVGAMPTGLVAADFDRNGATDLAVSNTGSSSVSILLGDGNGTLVRQMPDIAIGQAPDVVESGDFNRDAIPDLAVNSAAAKMAFIFQGTGTGTFSQVFAPETGGDPCLDVGDFNVDGALDLLVSPPDDSRFFGALLGNGSGQFPEPFFFSYAVGFGPRAVVTADFDRDSTPDFVSANHDSNDIQILLNACNLPPGLGSTGQPPIVTTTTATLQWFTDFPADTAVEYGLTASYGNTLANGTRVTEHAPMIMGLSPNTTYHYRYSSTTNRGFRSTSSDRTFTTLAATPPTAPSNVVATLLSSNQIRVSWQDNRSDEIRFEVERQTDGGAFTQIAMPGVGVTSFTDSGRTSGPSYTYRVRAVNGNGVSAYAISPAVTIITLQFQSNAYTAAEGAPATIAVSRTGSTAGSVSVQYATRNGSVTQPGDYTPVSGTLTLGSGQASGTFPIPLVSDRLLEGDETINLTLSSPSGAVLGAQTTAVITLGDDLAASAPNNLIGTSLSSTAVRLDWIDRSDNETGFQVERRIGTGSFTPLNTVGANQTRFDDTGCQPLTQYSYRVRATGSAANSTYSAVVSVSTPPAPPAPPASVFAAPLSTTEVRVAWADSSSNETGFEVERSTDGGGFVPVATLGAGLTSFTDGGLALGPTYIYRVRAVNVGGASAYTTAPAVTIVTLQFSAATYATPEGGGAATITVTRTGNATVPVSVLAVTANGTAREPDDYQAFSAPVSLAPGQMSSQFSVTLAGDLRREGDETLNLALSTPVGALLGAQTTAVLTVQDDLAAPAPGTLTAVALGSTTVRLNWMDRCDNETGFRVERQTGGGSFILAGMVGAGQTQFNDTGLTPGTAYNYRVHATSMAADSAFSSPAPVTTLLPGISGTVLRNGVGAVGVTIQAKQAGSLSGSTSPGQGIPDNGPVGVEAMLPLGAAARSATSAWQSTSPISSAGTWK